MTEVTTSERYSLTITLLEDLHTGTGTGTVTVDAVQARDSKGNPVIDRHHFRGVLKDNAKRLKELGIINSELDTLFGKGGSQQRKLDCSSLKAESKDCLIYWDATARQENSRCPEENSLRRFEYIKAGTTLTGRITLSKVTADEITAFKSILQFTNRLGAERTRGSGQISILIDEETTINSKPDKNPIDKQATTLKILLTNKEPMCIPKSGQAGNIIHSESFIPGRTLFAALAAISMQAKDEDMFKALFDSNLKVGNAYPYPIQIEDIEQDLSKLQSIPMPNQIHAIKQTASDDSVANRWPHWAKSVDKSNSQLNDDADINLFASNNKHSKTSRPKGEIYLIQDEKGNWRRYTQPLTIRMRNQRGHPLGKKSDDTEITRRDTELFSEQRIPENTHFIAEIHCTDNGLLQTVSNYLSKTLYIGRGKAPVALKKLITINDVTTKNSPVTPEEYLTITAKSDWILRGENLGYLSELNKNTLAQAFGIESDEVMPLELKVFQESETQGSFNYATGMQKRPFIVIRRGSSYKLSGDNTSIETIRNALPKQPIGERTREGYGQFAVDLPVTLINKEEEEQKARLVAEQRDKDKQALLEKAQPIIDKAESLPNAEEWQALIDPYHKIGKPASNPLIIANYFSKLGNKCYSGIGNTSFANKAFEVLQEDSLVTAEKMNLFLELLAELSVKKTEEAQP